MHDNFIEIGKSKKKFDFADKSLKIYRIQTKLYTKLLEEHVIATYTKSSSKTIEKISNREQNIFKNFKIPCKIPKLQQQEAFITLKDHKTDVSDEINCRIIKLTFR